MVSKQCNFFQESYLLPFEKSVQHNIYDEDVYTINIVDHLCNMISFGKDECIEIDSSHSKLYNVISISDEKEKEHEE